MADFVQDVRWPGVGGVVSCEGTISHGIMPSTFTLTTYPQIAKPLLGGVLAWSDGTNLIRLTGCKVSAITGRAGPDGQTWVLSIQDRRWRWRGAYGGFGAVDGKWNRQDKSGKLIPWSIRSPVELAAYCLDALGEVGYLIDLPVGLTRKDGADLDRYLLAGENFAQSVANPTTFWDRTPPAEALSRLCDYFGRRVVYQPIRDRVVIAAAGNGGFLPAGGMEVEAIGVSDTSIPAAVGVAGMCRFQMRFHLEAVGEEWDGKYVPINDLSYAPKLPGQKQISTVTLTASPPPNPVTISITISWLVGAFPVSVSVGDTDPTIDLVWPKVIAQIQGNSQLNKLLSASASGNVLTLTGNQSGQAFTVAVTTGGDNFATAIVQPAGKKDGRGWNYSPPPRFPGVLPTDRLAYTEAQAKARNSVWRCYRIVNRQYGTDPDAKPVKPLFVPRYGPIKRRQQIVLQPTKVEQVVPQARNSAGQQRGEPIVGVLADFYNGYSRDQQGIVFGSVCLQIGSVLWTPADGSPNTDPFSRVYVPFDVIPEEQMIVFAEPVYALEGEGYVEPRLTLETGCLVEDNVTGQVVRVFETLALGGPAPAEWQVQDDLEIGVVGQYGNDGTLAGVTLQDVADVRSRAAYYLAGMASRHQLPASVTRQWPGLLPIDPDGAIQQVTWSVGPEGPTTIASTNTEHAAHIPEYPARRRAENLSPSAAAALANQSDPFGRMSGFLPPGAQ